MFFHNIFRFIGSPFVNFILSLTLSLTHASHGLWPFTLHNSIVPNWFDIGCYSDFYRMLHLAACVRFRFETFQHAIWNNHFVLGKILIYWKGSGFVRNWERTWMFLCVHCIVVLCGHFSTVGKRKVLDKSNTIDDTANGFSFSVEFEWRKNELDYLIRKHKNSIINKQLKRAIQRAPVNIPLIEVCVFWMDEKLDKII